MAKPAKILLGICLIGGLAFAALLLFTTLFAPGCSPFARAPQKGQALDDYTFEDLSQIAALIQTSKNPVHTAAEYGICDESGVIKDQIKRFKLKDDTICEVRVVGIMQDKLSPAQENGDFDLSSLNPFRTSGSSLQHGSKAGLTFVCAEVPATSVYMQSPTADGGWQSSELRSYLATTLFNNLPDYLQQRIVSVEKMTNNVGYTSDASSATATQDKVWEPSVIEVNGEVNWDEGDYASGRRPNDTVMNAEGAQYQWFSQSRDASGTLPPDKLQMTFRGMSTSWWYRTIFPTSTMFGSTPYACCVMESGYPNGHLDVTTSAGVAFGFCL